MRHFKYFRKSLLAVVGFLLSPLSWWNDLFVNIPLAYSFAVVVRMITGGFFTVSLVGAYWASNVIGLLMLHRGLSVNDRNSRRDLALNIVFSLFYTALIVAAVQLGWLKFPTEYLSLGQK